MENGIRVLADLGVLRLSHMLYGRLPDEVWEQYEELLLPDVTKDVVAAIEYTELLGGTGGSGAAWKGTSAEASGKAVRQRLFSLTALCGSEIVLVLIELLMLRVDMPEAAELLEWVSPGNGSGVTLLTAARVCGYTDARGDAILPMRQAYETAGFLLECSQAKGVEFFQQVWQADSYLLTFLAGGDLEQLGQELGLTRFAPSGDPVRVFGFAQQAGQLASRVEALLAAGQAGEEAESAGFCVLIEGERESGRYTTVRAVAQQLSLPVLAADLEMLHAGGEPARVIRRLVRESVLEGRALCLRNLAKGEGTVRWVRQLLCLYRKYTVAPLFLLSDASVKLAPFLPEQYLAMQIPDHSRILLELWEGYLPEEYRHMASSLASKMRLLAGQVEKVGRACRVRIAAGDVLEERDICRICYEILDDGRYENVTWVKPGFTMDDLKVEPEVRAVLEDLCRQVELRDQVYGSWKLKSRYAYGRCVSAIFAGPPGTGKTMAVHALAGRLGLELYKVDLSQIVDKYIGETEKRLEEVFTRAQKSNMILFFDEADAVMGKRSEVKEAQDKYANTEISFILQRLEAFDGIVILATNNLQNIDAAFMRRIRYVVNFQLPDEETRLGIWKGAFGEGVPQSDDIDYEYLAQHFRFSGGEIKNVALNAVFYGASDGGEVAMRHIMRAIRREMTKNKRISLNDDFGKYAYLLHG